MATKTKAEYSPGFLRWWATYPPDRRLDKKRSYVLWKKFKLENRTDELIEKLERLIQTTWRNCERKYIKTSFYYLKHERHEDDLMPLTFETTINGQFSSRGSRGAQAAKNVLLELERNYGKTRSRQIRARNGATS